MKKHLYYYAQHSQYETPTYQPSISYCGNENEVHYYAPNQVHKVSNFQEFMEYLGKRTNSEITPEQITFNVYEYGAKSFLQEMKIGTKTTFTPVMISGCSLKLGPYYTYYPNSYEGKFEYDKIIEQNNEGYDPVGISSYEPIIITEEILRQLDGRANIVIYPGYE